MNNEFKEMELLADSTRGVNIPRDFANMLNSKMIANLTSEITENLEVLKLGSESEDYWEAWDYILDKLELKLDNSDKVYKLHHDNDLFAVIY